MHKTSLLTTMAMRRAVGRHAASACLDCHTAQEGKDQVFFSFKP